MGVGSTTNVTEIVKVTTMATIAIVFARIVKPSPARQSRTIPPNRRLLTSQRSKRSDDFEKKNAASRTGPTVGMSGTATPTNATPRKKNPRTRKIDRSTRLLAMVIDPEA